MEFPPIVNSVGGCRRTRSGRLAHIRKHKKKVNVSNVDNEMENSLPPPHVNYYRLIITLKK